MVAFLKLLVNKGFSPAAQVQNTLSLFDYDVDKAEKFLTSYKTVPLLFFLIVVFVFFFLHVF